MEFDLDQSIAVLARTPAVLQSMLGGLPAEWTTNNEGQGSWSPYDVIGHLIHAERTNWIPRATHILDYGEARPFETFNRSAQFAESRDRSLEEMLAEFSLSREQSLTALRALGVGAAELEKTGLHPDLGPVKLKELLATWLAHDLDHIGQIARTMAKQYTHAVGPWKAYLSILGDRQK
jgi:DinB superfamily